MQHARNAHNALKNVVRVNIEKGWNEMDNATYIFQELRKAGATVEGACAMLGNLEAESGVIPCRVEGDYTPPYETSRRYANNVDNGIISRQTFISDGKGWGIAQWTYHNKNTNMGRKQAFYDYCRARSISIANLEVQTEFLIRELKADFGSVWAAMCNGASLKDCSDQILLRFENPYDKSEGVKNYRYGLGLSYYNRFKSGTAAPADQEPEQPPADQEPDTPETVYFPPRMLCEGMSGTDVRFLQDCLNYRGYKVTASGNFDADTKEQLKHYQADTAALDVDGVAGPLTFSAITDLKERTFKHE